MSVNPGNAGQMYLPYVGKKITKLLSMKEDMDFEKLQHSTLELAYRQHSNTVWVLPNKFLFPFHLIKLMRPGKNRQLSIYQGLQDIRSYADNDDYVLILSELHAPSQ